MAATMNRSRATIALVVAVLASALLNVPAGAAVELPDGFSVETVASGFDTPTSVAFGSDGAIYVTEKRGRVLTLDGPGDATPSLVRNLQAQVHNNSDRGLTGLAADPFDPNAIYVGYSFDRLPGAGLRNGSEQLRPVPEQRDDRLSRTQPRLASRRDHGRRDGVVRGALPTVPVPHGR